MKIKVLSLTLVMIMALLFSCNIQEDTYMTVTVEARLKDLLIELTAYSQDTLFISALDKADEMIERTDYITRFGKAYEQLTVEPMSKFFVLNKEMQDERIIGPSNNAEVLVAIRKIALR